MLYGWGGMEDPQRCPPANKALCQRPHIFNLAIQTAWLLESQYSLDGIIQ